MEASIDQWYLNQKEPYKEALFVLRKYILNFDDRISEEWKFNIPYFCLKGKMFCYFWFHKSKQIYISFAKGKQMNHPALISEGRKQVKILLIDPTKDMDLITATEVLNMAVKLY